MNEILTKDLLVLSNMLPEIRFDFSLTHMSEK